MADLKITSAVVNDIVALQKSAATIGKKTEAQQQADNSRADAAVQVDVNPKTAALAEASPPTELNPDEPVIAEQEARDLAASISGDLKNTGTSFAGASERTILSLFG